MSFFPQMSSSKDTNDLAVFCVWLESAATRRTCFASSRLQSKSQYLRECHPREPSPKKTKRKNWFRKFFFFSAFWCPSPLNNVLELPWIFVLSYSWWLRWQRICLQFKKPGFDLWVGKIPWRRERLSTPVFLPGESHGQRSLVGYSPWGYKELDTIEWLTLSLHFIPLVGIIPKALWNCISSSYYSIIKFIHLDMKI